MKDDFREYELMKECGLPPAAAFLRASVTGLDFFAQIRMLRSVFGLSVEAAKEVTVTATGKSISLTEHQQKLFPALMAALKIDAEKNDQSK